MVGAKRRPNPPANGRTVQVDYRKGSIQMECKEGGYEVNSDPDPGNGEAPQNPGGFAAPRRYLDMWISAAIP